MHPPTPRRPGGPPGNEPGPEPGFEFDVREHGVHVPAPQPGATPIDWRTVRPSSGNARVLDETCSCRARVFEMRTAGGVRFIARIDSGKAATYSPPLNAERSEMLWKAILSGQAR